MSEEKTESAKAESAKQAPVGGQQSQIAGIGGEAAGPSLADRAMQVRDLRRRRLIAAATRYHAQHPELVAEFNELTKNACANGKGGVGYQSVRTWQRDHGVAVDGMVGPNTLAAARALSAHGGAAAAGENAQGASSESADGGAPKTGAPGEQHVGVKPQPAIAATPPTESETLSASAAESPVAEAPGDSSAAHPASEASTSNSAAKAAAGPAPIAALDHGAVAHANTAPATASKGADAKETDAASSGHEEKPASGHHDEKAASGHHEKKHEAKEKEHDKGHADKGHGPLRLQTALDSRVQVRKVDDTSYVASLPFGEHGAAVPFATYKLINPNANVQQLPIYIEDAITDANAMVRVKYDPKQVQVQQLHANGPLGGHNVSIQLVPTNSDQLLVDKAPAARDFGDGRYTVESSEKITSHSSGSAVDKIAGSIASAEGGFGSTEASDGGIFTWGQGQWIVTNGELQKVLGFIKAARQDLFDKYWGAMSLDVQGTTFVFAGDKFAPNTKDMLALFRPSAERNKLWTDLFAQAGMDPQIQRIQRQYIRGEVAQVLDEKVGEKREKHKVVQEGHKPSDWLTTRGQALYYSMNKNLPKWAMEYFTTAVQAAGAGGEEVAEHQREAASASLEQQFENSGVIAHDGHKHHIISFWGESGRQQAIAECDTHIADPSKDKVWKKEQWEKHKSDMQKRQSRYQKTAADITAALNHQEVEPDVPADMGGDKAPAAQVAEGAPGPQQPAGESSQGGLLDRIEDGVADAGHSALHWLESQAEAGAEASEKPQKAQNAGHGAAPAGLSPGSAKHEPAKQEPHPAAATQGSAAPAPHAAAIDAGGLAKALAELNNAQLSQVALNLDALVAKSKELQKDPSKDKRQQNEVSAAGRRDFLADIQKVRGDVTGLDQTGIAPAKLAPIKGRMFRTIQELSPYHAQGWNVNILETNKEVHSGNQMTRTCNVTSLSMALEGLGKSSKEYDGGRRQQVLAVGKHFHDEMKTAELTEGAGAGWESMMNLRMPDFLELAAIAEVLGDGKDDDASIKAAATTAYEKILNIEFLQKLAGRFGVQAQIKYFSFDGKQTHSVQGKGGKVHEESGTEESEHLGSAGKAQRHEMDQLIDLRNKAEALRSGGNKGAADEAAKKYMAAKAAAAKALGGDEIEKKLPLEAYKKAVKEQVGAELDSGAAVETHVVQHFVRLHAIEEEYVVIDDPSQAGRAHKKVLWDEARASGLFDKRLVLR